MDIGMKEDKPVISIITMSKKDQQKHIKKHIVKRKYQVNIEILGKKKFAYCDDLAELDPLIKETKGKILKVIKIND